MNLQHLTDAELLELRADIDKILRSRLGPKVTTRVKLWRPENDLLAFVKLLRAATSKSLVECAEAVDRGDIIEVPDDFLLDVTRFLGPTCIQG